MGDIYEYSLCYGGPSGPLYCDPVDAYQLDTITSQSIISGGVQNNYNGWISNYGRYTGIYATRPSSGSIYSYSTPIIDTNLMPEEFGQSDLYYYFPTDSSYCMAGSLYAMTDNHLHGGSTFGICIGPCYTVNMYKYPLGHIEYFYIAEFEPFTIIAQKLIYYHQAGLSCDTLLIPDTTAPPPHTSSAVVSKQRSNAKVCIMPNPTSDGLIIKTSQPGTYTIAIFNQLSQLVTYTITNQQQTTINVSMLPAGVYNVCITDDSGNRHNEKVVVRR